LIDAVYREFLENYERRYDPAKSTILKTWYDLLYFESYF